MSLENVYVGLASMPSRTTSLRQVVETLLPQCGRLGVYLNNFDEVPAFLNDPKIEIARSQEHGDLKDNGKFFFLESSSLRYYATVDDDISYPSDYVSALLEAQIQTRGIVGVHGSYYPKQIENLLTSRFVVHFKEAFEHLMPVTLLGTGTALLDQATVQLKFADFGEPGMADVWLAAAAKKKRVSLWCIPRDQNWLSPIPQSAESDEQSLFVQGKRDDSVQVNALKDAGVFGSISEILESVVRSPQASIRFGKAQADYLWSLTRVLPMEVLSKKDRHLYDYALAKHKRVSCEREGHLALIEFVDTYSKWLVEMISRDEGSIIRDGWVNQYFNKLKETSPSDLPFWAASDLQKSNAVSVLTRGRG